MEFRVLGPVEVCAAGRPLAAGHAKQRAVLAVLVLELNQVVPREQLIDRVWGDDPPASVRNVLYSNLTRLKAALHATREPGAALTRGQGGYVLHADPESVDLFRFRRLTRQARVAACDEEAARLLGEALGLWQGEALAGLASPWLDGMRRALGIERLAVRLDLNDISLRRGQHQELLPGLTQQAAAYPADERLAAQLMLALYRSGRQAEALRRYEQTRHQLTDELGADPSPALRALHQQILTSHPTLTAPQPAAAAMARPVPRELPADVTAFTGRSAELAELDRLLGGLPGTSSPGAQAATRAPGPVVVSSIGGTAGVGKTALAVHWAHHVADRFPDGQLYVNLRGFDPGQPMDPADALAGFLASLGVAGADMPDDTEHRAARYRSLLTGRTMLVVLDNAGDAEQIRPLLPGSPGCMVVVTSRDSLPGLVARDGAHRVDLSLLPLGEAVGLLRSLVGDRVDADHAAAAALATHCARLPLALRIAAELTNARPSAPLSEVAAELAGHQRRLDLLDAGGDPRAAVRAVFSWSYGKLDDGTARAFRLLGLHPGAGFDSYAVAALTGTTARQADQALHRLTRAYLIQPTTTPGRYSLHDLLRDYAHDLTAEHDPAGERHAAQTRLLDHHLHAASTAMDVLFPWEKQRRPQVPVPGTPVPPINDGTARAWLDGHRPTLIALAAHASGHGWPGHATALGTTLRRYLESGGHYTEFATLATHALRAAQQTGDHVVEADILVFAAIIDIERSRLTSATPYLERALALRHEAGDRDGEARVLQNLGIVARCQGRYVEATSRLQQAVTLFRACGDRPGEHGPLTHLALIDLRQGRYGQAVRRFRRCVAAHHEAGRSDAEAYDLVFLSLAEARGGYTEATRHSQQALTIFRDRANPSGEAAALEALGLFALREGDPEQAIGHLQRSLAVSRSINEKTSEAPALISLGMAHLAAGLRDSAHAHFTSGLVVLSAVEWDGYDQARAHDGLGQYFEEEKNSSEAHSHWQQALRLYAALGAPEAEEVRARLATGPVSVAPMPGPAHVETHGPAHPGRRGCAR